MSGRPVRVGVVGAGYWGANLLRNFASLGALAAVADVDAERRQQAESLYPDVPVASRAIDLFEREDIDAVVIATPAVTHGELVARALDHGKHVLVEKPLCLDVKEAMELRDQASAAGLVLMVGHVLLYHPAFIALQGCVAEGDLGRLRYVYSNRLSLGKIRREENALWSFAPHDVSMILQLTGELPVTVTAAGGHYLHPEVADTTLTHMDFADGVQGHIFVSWLHPYKDHRLVVVGETGMLVFDDVARGAEKLMLYRHGVAWDGSVPVVTKATPEVIDFDEQEPLRVECESFLAAITQGSPPRSDADEGIRVLHVLQRCQEALLSGERVAVGTIGA